MPEAKGGGTKPTGKEKFAALLPPKSWDLLSSEHHAVLLVTHLHIE